VLRKWFSLSALALTMGCNSIWNGWLDPSQVGRFRQSEATTEILRSISVADEPLIKMNSVEPEPQDLEVNARDYLLGPDDMFDMSITDLFGPGQPPWIQLMQVSREGYIKIPQIKQPIKAAGKSTLELQEHIKKVLADEGIASDSDVTILIRQARHAMINILGAVGTPGSINIPRPDFRLMDALAAVGGITPVGGPRQPLVRMVYVYRADQESSAGPITTMSPATQPAELVSFDTVEQPETGGQQTGHWIYAEGEWKFVPETATTTSAPATSAARPTVAATGPATQAAKPAVVEKAQETWEELAEKLPQKRMIGVPLDKLEEFNNRYNIVIRDGDTIWVPPPMQGEYYVMGNVFRPGPYSLTGRDISIRQAIATAGVGPLADPGRCELTRRIGGDRAQILYVNLDRVFAGKDPDVYLKPDDVINVGTNPALPFLAVIRNAFRLTYGFGFVYDRNFADIDAFSSQQNPMDRRRVLRAQRGLP